MPGAGLSGSAVVAEGSVANLPLANSSRFLREFLGCDTDVALMIARFAGAGLGLLAFAITAIAGVWVHNPVTVTLSRSILALLVFCAIGLTLGTAAQLVIREHEKQRESDIHQRYRETPAENQGRGPETESTPGEGASAGT